MRKTLFFSALLISGIVSAQGWMHTPLAPMPVAVSNNAVCEGLHNGNWYVYSFGGIDSTKTWSGITRRAFRYDVTADQWDTLPPVPDTLGKIASAASRIGNRIYVAGGYHVFQNGNEQSSNRLHIFDIASNAWLPDGAPIPLPIDDQVQCVYKDSLLFIVTGWNNTTNVPNVQIYNPATNSWLTGTATPNNTTYKAFGASGVIIGDTLYYYGGASTAFNFPGQQILRKGAIDPLNPAVITWVNPLTGTGFPRYRSACTTVFHTVWQACWLGGSDVTYNYDAIAYNGSGVVPLVDELIYYRPFTGDIVTVPVFADTLPIDLRGIAEIDTVQFRKKIICGGMRQNGTVTRNTWLLDYYEITDVQETFLAKNTLSISPVPANDAFRFPAMSGGTLQIIAANGSLVSEKQFPAGTVTVDCSSWPEGLYLCRYKTVSGASTARIIVTHHQ